MKWGTSYHGKMDELVLCECVVLRPGDVRTVRGWFLEEFGCSCCYSFNKTTLYQSIMMHLEMRSCHFQLLVLAMLAITSSGFIFQQNRFVQRRTALCSSVPSDVSSFSSNSRSLGELKDELVETCTRSTKPMLEEVRTIVRELEEKAELVGEGQASSVSGLLDGEWYVVVVVVLGGLCVCVCVLWVATFTNSIFLTVVFCCCCWTFDIYTIFCSAGNSCILQKI